MLCSLSLHLVSQSFNASSPSGVRRLWLSHCGTEDRAQGSGPNLITRKMRNGEIFPKQWSLVLVQTFFQTDSSVSDSISKISVLQAMTDVFVLSRSLSSLASDFDSGRSWIMINKECIFLAHLLICMRQTITFYYVAFTWNELVGSWNSLFYWIMKHFKCNDF